MEFVDQIATETDLYEIEDETTGDKRKVRIKSIANVTVEGTKINKKVMEYLSNSIDNMPVGSILMWYKNTLPSDKWAFGNTPIDSSLTLARSIYGEKTPDTRGKVLVDMNPQESEFANLGRSGGEKAHTLTIGEMPRHQHELQNTVHANYTGASTIGNSQGWGGIQATNAANGDNRFIATAIGESIPHNNLQPYMTIRYIFKIKE